MGFIKHELLTISSSIIVTFSFTIWSFRRYFKEPSDNWLIERLNLRILLAAPLLCLLCTIALLAPQYALVCECFLSIFEGYALFVFFCLMALHVGSKLDVISFLDQQAKPLEWKVCKCVVLKRFKDGNSCFHFLAVSVLQYMFVKPFLVLTLFVAVHEGAGRGPDVDRKLRNLQTMTKTLSLISLLVALTALLQLYRFLSTSLGSFQWLPHRFLCIKLLVFLVTVQKIIVAIALNEFPSNPRNENSKAIHLYLILLLYEAPFYASLLQYYFGYSGYLNLDEVVPSSSRPFDTLWALVDVVSFHHLLPIETALDLESSDSPSPSMSPNRGAGEDSSLVRVRLSSHQLDLDRSMEMTTGPLHSSLRTTSN